ncbi:MAG: YihY/virulence factor BrkB family protein [Gemmobacter sp.]
MKRPAKGLPFRQAFSVLRLFRIRRPLSLLRGAYALWERIEARELGLIAAGVAFFGFLALFPALAAIIALWGFAADPAVISGELELLADFLPSEAFTLLRTQVDGLLQANNRQLGWTTLFSTVLALWSARAGVAALIRGLNAIHDLPPRMGIWHQVQALVLTFVLVALALTAMGMAVVVPLIIVFLPLGAVEVVVLELLNLLLGVCLVVVAVGLLYRFGPNREAGKSHPLLTPGLLIALVLWAAVSRGLVLYFANFASYNQVYGSIGAVVALLMWFYLSAYAFLLGAAFDAERQARRRQ